MLPLYTDSKFNKRAIHLMIDVIFPLSKKNLQSTPIKKFNQTTEISNLIRSKSLIKVGDNIIGKTKQTD